MKLSDPWAKYLRALGRFWLFAIVGVLLSAFAAADIAYVVRFGPLPKLTSRTRHVYTAVTELQVSGPAHPPRSTTTTGTSSVSGLQVHNESIKLANIYPQLVLSDAVGDLRSRLYGHLPGQVTAATLNSSFGVSYRAGAEPFIDVTATAGSKVNAERLALGTAQTFIVWLRQRQIMHAIPTDQRVIVTINKRIAGELVTGGPKSSLSIVAFVIFVIIVLLLCVVLDSVFPRRPRRAPQPAT